MFQQLSGLSPLLATQPSLMRRQPKSSQTSEIEVVLSGISVDIGIWQRSGV